MREQWEDGARTCDACGLEGHFAVDCKAEDDERGKGNVVRLAGGVEDVVALKRRVRGLLQQYVEQPEGGAEPQSSEGYLRLLRPGAGAAFAACFHQEPILAEHY